MQVCNYVSIPECKHAGKEVLKQGKHASMQACKYLNCIYTSMQVCEYLSMQVWKFVSMQVCKYASLE